MSRLRQVNDLYDAMAEDFAWRKKELHLIKSDVHRNRDTNHEYVSVRGGIALLYAHWEGFVKNASTLYVRFISDQRCRYDELSDTFVALTIRSKVAIASQSKSTADHHFIVNLLRKRQNERGVVQPKGAISTRSNLNTDVLQEIIQSLDLDFRPFESKRNLIDESLLANRNTVAHGSYVSMSVDGYLDLHDEIIGLMQTLFDQILDSASRKRYLNAVLLPAP